MANRRRRQQRNGVPVFDAVIYARFSPTGRDKDDCESCSSQIDLCKQYCAARKLTVIEIFQDKAESGAKVNRENFIKAKKLAVKIRAVLVVYDFSRMMRNALESLKVLEELHMSGANVVSVREAIDTTTTMGKCVFTIVCAINEADRESKRDITSDHMLRLQAAGRKISRYVPYGYKQDKSRPKLCDNGSKAKNRKGEYIYPHLLPDEREQRILRLIIDLKASGLAINAICTELNGQNIPPRRAAGWHPMTISQILDRETAKTTGTG